jgi:hypothetical protein
MKMIMHRAAASLAAFTMILLGGCAASPGKAIFDTDESQLELRSYQARTIESSDELEVMRDVIDTLQDLGFVLENADAGLGTISGSRTAGGPIRMTVTVRPRGQDAFLVRANAQRGTQRVDDPAVYQEFFNALKQSGFITAGTVR